MSATLNRNGHYKSYLPLRQEVERCACPICIATKATPLLPFDQFGFPVGTTLCQACGFVYSNPRPTEEYMKRFYEKYFWFFFEGMLRITPSYMRRQRLKEWARLRVTRCRPHITEMSRVLDVGCGAGMFLDELHRQLPMAELVGVDPDPKMVKYCRETLQLNVHDGFFEHYFDSGRFDVITMFHVLEHLYDLDSFFEFLRAHLKPGGLVIVESPDIDGDWRTIYMIHFAHLHYFAPRTISYLFAKNGFEIVDIKRLENELDKSNLFLVARKTEKNAHLNDLTADPDEAARVSQKFHALRHGRSPRILRSWLRLGFFALRAAVFDS